MRIADVCTRLDDAITVAALYVCLMRMLWRLKRANQRWRIYPAALIAENRWLAQRYGVKGSLVDFGTGQQVPLPELMEEIIELVAEDAEALDCVAEVQHAREIAARGTSADRQLATWRAEIEAGTDRNEALKKVVAELVSDTSAGLD